MKTTELTGVLIDFGVRTPTAEPKHRTGYLEEIISQFPHTSHSLRAANGDINSEAKPFLQWVGGKRSLIEQYKGYFPSSYRTYHEPLVGGGAVFFHLRPQRAVLNDSNLELIRAYEGVRDNPFEVIHLLKNLKAKHSEDLYKLIRSIDREVDIFDSFKNSEIAARMVYLNQTCFNGVYRVNGKGNFNVPIGSSLNRLICDEQNILKVSEALKNVSLECRDFEEVLNNARNDDFVYLDPPYHPISQYSDFTRYTKEKFYKEDQLRLKSTVDKLTKKGCKVMLSNSDCELIRKIYSGYNIITVYCSRSLNSKKDQRGRISELLITNY